MEYEIETLLITECQAYLTAKAAEGWQVHTQTLVGSVTEAQSGQEIPLFTFLLHRMVPSPEETEEDKNTDEPKAMAMKG